MARIIMLSFLLQACAVVSVATPVVLKACEFDVKCKAAKLVINREH